MAKQYEVIGAAVVHGHKPGEKFHADLEPAHETRMLGGGFLRIAEVATAVKPKAASKPKEAPASADDDDEPEED